MPIQAPQWTDFRLCPVCQNEYNQLQKPPISLGCGHSICQSCLFRLSKQQCPFDQAAIQVVITKLPINYALLSLVGGDIPEQLNVDIPDVLEHKRQFDVARNAIEVLAQSLQNVVISGNSSSSNSYSTANGSLTRPMQRKLVTLIHSQLAEEEGRARAMRSARSIGERAVKELILMHQSPQTLSAALWAAVRQRGCQFLGPAMQDAVLRLILLSLEDGISLSRKVLVLFVVQKLEKQFTQASKTSIGHVVQLLYRASCFKVTKRDGDSSLLQLHEKYRTYSALRKEHDAQIVQIAMEAGLHISPEQWSALLYGDDEHKSHMQSIIDKLQTPASFASSIQELIIALQRTDDPHDLQSLRLHLDRLSAIDPCAEADPPAWDELEESMKSLHVVVSGLQNFAKDYAAKNKGNIEGAQMINTKYRTSMCRDILQRNTCPRGANCNFAHSEEELERYRKRRHMPVNRLPSLNGTCMMNGGLHPGSRTGSSSSPDSCSNGDLDEDLEAACCNSSVNGSLSVAMQPANMIPHYQPGLSHQHHSPISHPPQPHRPDSSEVVLSDSFKALNIVPFSPPSYPQQQQQHQHVSQQQQQQQIKKDEVIQPRDILKVPQPTYEVSMPPQQMPPRPNPYQQVQYQPAYYDMPRETPNPNMQPQQQQQTMFLQSNQTPFLSNNQQVYQHQQPMQQVYSYQQEYQQQQHQHYPTMFASQPFPVNYNMRTAIARGLSSESTGDLLKQSTTNELSLNIPSTKESKEDSWKFGGSSKSTSFNRVDSCLDSGRGSSIGYSSDTFSPLSSASAGSRGSPQSVQESDTRKIWDSKIWGAPTETTKLGVMKKSNNFRHQQHHQQQHHQQQQHMHQQHHHQQQQKQQQQQQHKLKHQQQGQQQQTDSPWSSSRASRGWDNFFDSRLSDHEEQNTSSESVGKCHDHQSSVLDKQSSYSSMKEWPRSGDRLSNDAQGLLGLFPSGSPATKRPPPGFGLK